MLEESFQITIYNPHRNQHYLCLIIALEYEHYLDQLLPPPVGPTALGRRAKG
jgi:hypothetical protein